MASDLTHVSVSAQRASIEFELFQLVLKDDVYPWELDAENEIEALTTMESGWTEQLSKEEHAAIATKGQQFFQQLDQAWAVADSNVVPSNTVQAASTNAADPLVTIQTNLLKTFQERVPAVLIHQLTQTAQTLATQPIELADQLVQCVQGAFPGWGTEDLRVLARPYAFAMRSPETDKLALASQAVRPTNWDELSEIEQARLSLAIAHYALAKMSN